MTKSLGYKFVLFSILIAIFIAGCQGQHSSEEYVPDQIIVKFKESALGEAKASLNKNSESEVVHISPYAGFQVLQIPEGKTVPEMVEAYSKQPIVEYAEPNYIEEIPQPNGGEEMLHEAE